MTGFLRYTLRTTDPDAAREFYAAVCGDTLWGEAATVVPLPAPAVARGAPAHWLGHIGVDDVERTVAALVEHGAAQLGPTVHLGARRHAVVRDPFGALIAIDSDTTSPPQNPVVWHLSCSTDDAAALALYTSMFGWHPVAHRELVPEQGRHRTFAWDRSGPEVGSMANITGQPHIHPQWQHFFVVPDLEAAAAIVRARGGLVLPTMHTDAGAFAACDDPQGAAFGLCQRAAAR